MKPNDIIGAVGGSLRARTDLRKGWICPRCDAVRSPDVTSCDCRPPLTWKDEHQKAMDELSDGPCMRGEIDQEC